MLKFTSDGTHVLTIGEPGPTRPRCPNSNDTDGGLERHAAALQPGRYRGRSPGPTSSTSPTAMATTGSSWSTPRPATTSATGAPTARIPVDDVAPMRPVPTREDRDCRHPPQYFRNPVHCVRITHDDKVYVCDRSQQPDPGVRDRRRRSSRRSSSGRTRWAAARSGISTPRRIARRAASTTSTAPTSTPTRCTARSLRAARHLRPPGRNAGQFHWVHNLATDSEGNIYTAEVDTGKRAQKFVRSGDEGCPLKHWQTRSERRAGRMLTPARRLQRGS